MLTPGTHDIEKIEDPEFLGKLTALRMERDEKLAQEPHNLVEISQWFRAEMADLLAWYELEKVRWTVA